MIFRPADRPEIEALVDGTWHSGELRAWVPRDGSWEARVWYSLRPGHMCLVTLAADHIRCAGVDDGGVRPPD